MLTTTDQPENAGVIARASAHLDTQQVQHLVGVAQDLIDGSLAPSTRSAYRRDWDDFDRFCTDNGFEPLPAEPAVLLLYLAEMKTRSLARSTIERRLAAISAVHVERRYPSPSANADVTKAVSGLRRATAGERRLQKRPLTVVELRRMVATLGDDRKARRDRALLVVGFVGALRRAELVGIDVHHLDLQEEGYRLTIPFSKTDQEGRSRTAILPYSADSALCPVTALHAWRESADIKSGPVFRRMNRGGQVSDSRLTAQSVALVVKAACSAAGIDPADLAGHSLRAGFATTAAANGASERSIANQTGHRSLQVLRGYIRQATVFDDNAATSLGL